ncbi:hypothetical protein Tco_0039057, partial [Tanacetum coccineum]
MAVNCVEGGGYGGEEKTVLEYVCAHGMTSTSKYIEGVENFQNINLKIKLKSMEGIQDEVLGSASVLKRHRQEDESVDTTFGIADEVLGASLLKRHCEKPSESP